jgi:hypothetical protein
MNPHVTKLDQPGFTKSDKPKSMTFKGEFSSFEEKRKFWKRNEQIHKSPYMRERKNCIG